MPGKRSPTADADVLRLLVEGTVSETGTEFFRALVKNLAVSMNTAGAWVTEYLPGYHRLRAYAFWLNDGFVEDYEYDIADTPCAKVIHDKRLFHVPDRIIELYPEAIRIWPRSTRSATSACRCLKPMAT